MSYIVNFKEVETVGLESSHVAEALAGLRANEARYFWRKYKTEFEVFTPQERPDILAHIEKALAQREMSFPYTALHVAQVEVDGILWTMSSMKMVWQSMFSTPWRRAEKEPLASSYPMASTFQLSLKGSSSLPGKSPN